MSFRDRFILVPSKCYRGSSSIIPLLPLLSIYRISAHLFRCILLVPTTLQTSIRPMSWILATLIQYPTNPWPARLWSLCSRPNHTPVNKAPTRNERSSVLVMLAAVERLNVMARACLTISVPTVYRIAKHVLMCMSEDII